MDDRQVISDLRDRLLEQGVYSVESRGADTPERYSLRLTTAAARPASPKPAAAKANPEKHAEGAPPTGGTP
jgi:hypothetical protein